jgi:hypothetical protein
MLNTNASVNMTSRHVRRAANQSGAFPVGPPLLRLPGDYPELLGTIKARIRNTADPSRRLIITQRYLSRALRRRQPLRAILGIRRAHFSPKSYAIWPPGHTPFRRNGKSQIGVRGRGSGPPLSPDCFSSWRITDAIDDNARGRVIECITTTKLTSLDSHSNRPSMECSLLPCWKMQEQVSG